MVKEGNKSRCHFALHLSGAGIYIEAKGIKIFQIRKITFSVQELRSYRRCKPVARKILTEDVHM